MAQEIINVGAAPNDGNGDPLRTAFIKTNTNFSELFSRVQVAPPTTLVGSIGDLAGMVAYDSDFYYYCFADFDGSTVIWRQVPQAANALVTILTATGDITANAFIGDGSQLTNVAAGAPTSVVNGTSNVVVAHSGNISFSSNSISNLVLIATGTPIGNGLFTTGLVYAEGIIISETGVATVSGNISALAGNVSGNNIITTGLVSANRLSLTGNVTSALNLTSNLAVGGNVVITGSVVGNANVTGNVSAGNISVNHGITAVGNVSGQYIIGDGGLLSNITVTSNVAVTQIANGSSIFSVTGSGGNIIATVGGVANIAVFTTTGVSVTGNISSTANVDAGNINATSKVVASGNITGGNLITGGRVIASGNVDGLNINATQAVIATGNISAANVNATNGSYATTIVASGNITGGNIIANTKISSVNAEVTGNLDVSGNLNAPNASVYFSSGTLYGNTTTGVGALYVGPGGYTSIANTSSQFTTNINNFSRVNHQNINTGTNARNDIVVTADTGNANARYITLGMTNSNFANAAFTVASALDGYVYVAGTSTTGPSVLGSETGNLVLGSTNGQVKVFIGNTSVSNLITTFSSQGTYTTGRTISTGNITGGNLTTAGQVVATGNVTGGNLIAGFDVVASGNISATGNIASGNISTTGNIAVTGNIAAGNISGNIISTGNISGGNLIGTGTLYINSANSVSAIVNSGANGIGNIGSSTNYFNTVFAKATSAQYADLAESYLADAEYAPGTVLSFGGDKELTVSINDSDPLIAGVVSTNPAYHMNTGLEGNYVVALALAGRVPCLVQGPVTRGAMMVSAGNGRARAEKNPAMGTVIGKALEDFNGDLGTIEVIVGRL